MLTIYTNPDPGGNSVRKHKAIEFEVVGELPASTSKSAEQTKRVKKLIFVKLPKRNDMNH